MPDARVRPADTSDLAAIAGVAAATGQHDLWGGQNPAYIRHLMDVGRVVVAELDAAVAGFGAIQQIGAGPDAVSMLCDLFVDPGAHGRGCGRAMLADLWSTAARRMTFSSLHRHAAPLYTSFGLDAWWPLVYLHGDPARLPIINEWAIEPTSPDEVARYELDWTGIGRAADHRAWAARPAGESILVSCDDEVIAAGTVINSRRGPRHRPSGRVTRRGRRRRGRRGAAHARAAPGTAGRERAGLLASAAPGRPGPARRGLAVRRVRPVHGVRAGPAGSAPGGALPRPGMTGRA